MSVASEKWKRTHIKNLRKRKRQATVSYKGNNFHFVAWGGIEDLQLWKARRP